MTDCIQLLLATVLTTLARLGDIADRYWQWLFHVPLRIANADSITRIGHAP